MENASKALIIAGAILLAIAIIGIGMYVFNMASSTVNKADMSATEITAYNSEFLKYSGTQSGTMITELLNSVRNHNFGTDDNTHVIRIYWEKTAQTGKKGTIANDEITTNSPNKQIDSFLSEVNAGSKYKVTFSYSSTGLVKVIGINKVT